MAGVSVLNSLLDCLKDPAVGRNAFKQHLKTFVAHLTDLLVQLVRAVSSRACCLNVLTTLAQVFCLPASSSRQAAHVLWGSAGRTAMTYKLSKLGQSDLVFG